MNIIKLSMIILGITIIFLTPNQTIFGQAVKLSIEVSKEVSQRDLVKGKITDSQLAVFIAIRPLLRNYYWIQTPPEVGSDGSWEEYVYFGEPDVGDKESYAVLAVASRNRNLFNEGDKIKTPFPENPEIIAKSMVVRVIRKDKR